MVIVVVVVAVILKPPHILTIRHLKLGVIRLNDGQLVRNDTVTLGDGSLQRVIDNGIGIVGHAMPFKAAALGHRLAFNVIRPT